MKRTLFQLFNLLMAFTILVSSTGFGLVERSCQMRGKTVYLNLKEAEAKRCAADHKVLVTQSDKVTISKTPCCQDEITYENVDVTSSLTQLVAKFLKTMAHTFVAGLASLITWLLEVVFSSNSTSSVTANAPPLPSGRTLLSLIQSLLI